MATQKKFRTSYDYDSHDHSGLEFPKDELSLTMQSFKDEADINKIMSQWQKTGVFTHVNQYQGEYADLSSYSDNYHENLNTIIQAQDMFMSLPSSIRDDFKNDPGAFLDFVGNPDNKAKMVQYGLLEQEADAPIHAAGEASAPAPKELKTSSKAVQPDPTPSGA